MAGVELVKIIREKLKLNPWKMSQKMGKEVQSYLSLERKAQRITLSDLERLEQIWLEAGKTAEEFKKYQRECAKREGK